MKRVLSKVSKRHVLIYAISAVGGAAMALLLEWSFFKPRPVQLPVVVSSTSTQSPLSGLAPHELETRIRVNPCSDLHSYVCTLSRTQDPTGEVRRDAEGEVEVLRIYENIIRTNKTLPIERVDELLVREIYTPDRVRRTQRLFEKAKAGLVKFINSQPFQSLTYSDKQILLERIYKVRLELPPPASVYADEPDLFTRNDVYYERTTKGSIRIRLGGALLFTVKSQFNLAFTLSHELAHAIDPCELRADKIDILAYRGLSECFGTAMNDLAHECSSKGKLSEIFADWVATHVVADILSEYERKFTPVQIRSAVFSTVRDLCRDMEDDTFDEGQTTLSSSHPSVSYRVNQIFSQHPMIRKFLRCKDSTGPQLPGVPSYCFWPTTKEAGKSQ